MRFACRTAVAAAFAFTYIPVHAAVEADASKGSVFFEQQKCVQCHPTGGHARAQNGAPDLGRPVDRNYTPNGIASRMWNHAPTMWAALAEQKIDVPQVQPQDAANLFAYFYAQHYFERLGEAERGKHEFEVKGCSGCHALNGQKTIGPPVSEWGALTDPIVLVQKMWGHAAAMRSSMTGHDVKWPQLTGQNVNDILIYLQNLPANRGKALTFALPSAEGGAQLFAAKGCSNCHHDQNSLERKLGDSTLADVAAAMWDHAPQMSTSKIEISEPEMRKLVAYVWGTQFFEPKGDAAKGKKLFAAKHCAGCHDDASSGAPKLSSIEGPFSAINMVTVLWKHGPTMLTRMEAKKISWPTLTPREMGDLISYLNSMAGAQKTAASR